VLWTIFALLLAVWLLGLITGTAFGGLIHLVLVLAVAVLLIQVVTGRQVI
jgi:hypothetical protein